MTLKVEGIWCKTKSEFDRLVKGEDYDLVVSYPDITNRLLKSDPEGNVPSDIIISLYIQKLFNSALEAADSSSLRVAYMFKNLDQETVLNFRNYVEDIADKNTVDLIIINRCDYPKRGVLSKFDNVRFIDND